MSNTHPKTVHTFFPLDSDIVKQVYNLCCQLLNPTANDKTLSQTYTALRNIVNHHAPTALIDLRTAALFEQLQLSIANGTYYIALDVALHKAVIRFVASRDSLLLVHQSQAEEAPAEIIAKADNEHALEMLGDLDYAHENLRFINQQSQSLAATLVYAQKLLIEPTKTPLLDNETLIAMLKLTADTIRNIQTRATSATESLATADELSEQLDEINAGLIFKTANYKLMHDNEHLWLKNHEGEGMAITYDDIDAMLKEKFNDF